MSLEHLLRKQQLKYQKQGLIFFKRPTKREKGRKPELTKRNSKLSVVILFFSLRRSTLMSSFGTSPQAAFSDESIKLRARASPFPIPFDKELKEKRRREIPVLFLYSLEWEQLYGYFSLLQQ